MNATKISRTEALHPGLLEAVARSGPVAESWVELYRESGAIHVEGLAAEALQALRREDFEAGARLLEKIEHRLLPKLGGPASDPATCALAHRWFHSVEAFRHYRGGDHNAAEEHLTLAEQAIRSALAQYDFLIPFAYHCTDFCMQRARLARAVQAWLKMRDHLESLRGMHRGDVPLCRLPEGDLVSIDDVRRFYRSLDLPSNDRRSLHSLLDPDKGLATIENEIRRFYARLGPVIVY